MGHIAHTESWEDMCERGVAVMIRRDNNHARMVLVSANNCGQTCNNRTLTIPVLVFGSRTVRAGCVDLLGTRKISGCSGLQGKTLYRLCSSRELYTDEELICATCAKGLKHKIVDFDLSDVWKKHLLTHGPRSALCVYAVRRGLTPTWWSCCHHPQLNLYTFDKYLQWLLYLKKPSERRQGIHRWPWLIIPYHKYN